MKGLTKSDLLQNLASLGKKKEMKKKKAGERQGRALFLHEGYKVSLLAGHLINLPVLTPYSDT